MPLPYIDKETYLGQAPLITGPPQRVWNDHGIVLYCTICWILNTTLSFTFKTPFHQQCCTFFPT